MQMSSYGGKKKKQEFESRCEEYGFKKDDYGLSFEIFRNDDTKVEVSLVGFIPGGRCILGVMDPSGSVVIKTHLMFPQEVMISIRDYHYELMTDFMKKKQYSFARRLKKLIAEDEARLKNAGFGLEPYEMFNVYGSMSNARCVLKTLIIR